MLLRESTAATAGFVQVHFPQGTEGSDGTELTEPSAGQKQAAQPTTPPASHLLLEISRTGSLVRINVQCQRTKRGLGTRGAVMMRVDA